MTTHLKALGLATIDEYFAWCKDNGFEPSIEKSIDDRVDEVDTLRRLGERQHARLQIHHNPRKFLESACAGTLDPDEIKRPVYTEICKSIGATRQNPDYRDSLAAFLTDAERKTGFVFETVRFGNDELLYADGLIRLHDRRRQWIRAFEDWRPRTRNLARQFSSLCRHLLARYPVPVFMDSAWLRRDQGAYRFRDWFVHIGAGHNIRTAKTLFPMTKKQAHHFLDAPDGYAIEEALLWGDARALGGDRRLVEALLGSRLGDMLERDEDRRQFWMSVYRFFIANPMLDRRHIGPIVDFLYAQKFEVRQVVTGPGQVRRQPPPQPNLSMTRRTPDSLLRQVDEWHGALRNYRQAARLYFKRSGVPGFHQPAGASDAQGRRAAWHIRELLSGAELVAEGRKMRHCVATYAPSCAAGECSIWTMERHLPDETVQKHLTLELDRAGTLVEARGLANRLPTEGEKNVLKVWCSNAGLRISPYLYRW